MPETSWALVAAMLVLAAGCTQPAQPSEPSQGEDREQAAPCAWVVNHTACTTLPMNISGLAWIEGQDALLAGAAPGFTDPSTRSQAFLLDPSTLEARWSLTVGDAATEPPVLASASGERFFQLDGRELVIRGPHGVEQDRHRFGPIAWTGWSSPFTDMVAVETIPDSIGLDLHVFDLEHGRSGTVSLGERWNMDDGPDNVLFSPAGNRLVFAVSTYGDGASVEDPDCYWLDINLINGTHERLDRSCEIEPEGTLGRDRFLASRGDDLLVLDEDLEPIASRTVPDLLGPIRFSHGTAILAERSAGIGGPELPSVLLDADLDEIRTVDGDSPSGFQASPYHAGCVPLLAQTPKGGTSVKWLARDGTTRGGLELPEDTRGRLQGACSVDGAWAALAVGDELAVLALDGSAGGT